MAARAYPITSGLPRYFDFNGRNGRSEFFRALTVPVIAASVVMLCIVAAVTAWGTADAASNVLIVEAPTNLVFSLLVAPPLARRLHDLSRSAANLVWLIPVYIVAPLRDAVFQGMSGAATWAPVLHALQVLWFILTGVATVALIAALLVPGSKQANAYGPPPA